MNTTMPQDPLFKKQYQKNLKCLKLGGLQPKTIDAYARAIRRIGNYFDCRIDDLSSGQLLDYFSELLDTHSWRKQCKAMGSGLEKQLFSKIAFENLILI